MPIPRPFTREECLGRGRSLIESANLIRDANPARIGEAVAVYLEAAALLRSLGGPEGSPVDDDQASAWTHCGIALMRTGGPADITRALACFDRAIALRAPLAATGDPWF